MSRESVAVIFMHHRSDLMDSHHCTGRVVALQSHGQHTATGNAEHSFFSRRRPRIHLKFVEHMTENPLKDAAETAPVLYRCVGRSQLAPRILERTFASVQHS